MTTKNQNIRMTPQLFYKMTGVFVNYRQLDMLEHGHHVGIPANLSWEEKIDRWMRAAAVDVRWCKEKEEQQLLEALREGKEVCIELSEDVIYTISKYTDEMGEERFLAQGHDGDGCYDYEDCDSLNSLLECFELNNYGRFFINKR